MTSKEELPTQLESIGQAHLLRFLDDLEPIARAAFVEQLAKVDWELVSRLTMAIDSKSAPAKWSAKPTDWLPLNPRGASMLQRYAEAIETGKDALRNGVVAAFTVAGGDGSRLGWGGPKGTYPIMPITGHSLFRTFAEKIRRVGNVYGVVPRWYLMTSERNHEATVEFFEKNAFFGLDPDRVRFFSQGQLPTCDLSGKVLLTDKGELATSPDGHGGSLKALYGSGALAEMRADGVNTLSYFQVDNPLVSVADPLFIGLHILERSQFSSRALLKREWSEKLGIFCIRDGRLCVVEYVDLPEAQAKRVDASGCLVFGVGSPAIHLLDVEFIHSLTADRFRLPYHPARKRIPYIDETGTQVAPEETNGIKFETFVFDAMPMAERTLILEADRRSEFAPVKNRDGDDSPESCRKIMTELYASWLEEHGCRIPRDAESSADCVIEISPLIASESHDLSNYDVPPSITPKQEVCLS